MNARSKSDRNKQKANDRQQKKAALPETAAAPAKVSAPAPAPQSVRATNRVSASAPASKPVLEKAKVSAPAPAPKPVLEKTKVSAPAPAPKPAVRQEKMSAPAPAPQPVRKQAAAVLAPAAMPKPPQQAIESAVETIEQSFKAAGQGAVAVNRKLIDIARANMASGLDLAKDLAKAKSPLEFARLQMMFWDQHMKALAAQAQELQALSAELVAKANEPIREALSQ